MERYPSCLIFVPLFSFFTFFFFFFFLQTLFYFTVTKKKIKGTEKKRRSDFVFDPTQTLQPFLQKTLPYSSHETIYE